jgi:hypothetical protein
MSDAMSVDEILRMCYPVPPTQDSSCPSIEWMGLGHGSGIGEWKCKLQDYKYGDLLYGGGSENKDYKPCNCPDHNKCPVYLEQDKKEPVMAAHYDKNQLEMPWHC